MGLTRRGLACLEGYPLSLTPAGSPNLAGGSWATAGNWDSVPTGLADDILDFSTLNITANAVTTLDGNRPAGLLKFGDASSVSHSWTVNPGTGGAFITAPAGVTNSVVDVSGDQSAANGGWIIRAGGTVNFLAGSTITVAGGKSITLVNDSVATHTLKVAGTVTTTATHPAYITGTESIKVAAAGFAGWASSLGLSGDPKADFDKDGLADATEFVLGSDPKVVNSSGITSQKSGSNYLFTFNRADASETSDTTAASSPAPSADPSGSLHFHDRPKFIQEVGHAPDAARSNGDGRVGFPAASGGMGRVRRSVTVCGALAGSSLGSLK